MKHNELSQLKDFLRELFVAHDIVSISFDTRDIDNTTNTSFFAISGVNFDGHDFIHEAINKGARLVFVNKNMQPKLSSINSSNQEKIIYVEDTRLCLALSSRLLFPSRPKYLMAVTGTNGKTSTVSYCRQIMSCLGFDAASLGTIGLEIEMKDKHYEQYNNFVLTTASPIEFHKILNSTSNLVDYFVFEASSHGLEQTRISPDLDCDAVSFTSFSQDHLDYHSSLENYLSAKLKLFEYLADDALAVLSANMSVAPKILDHLTKLQKKHILIGTREELENTEFHLNDNEKLIITKLDSNIYGQNVEFFYTGKKYQFHTKIIGKFQIYNILIAAVMIHQVSKNFENIVSALETLRAPVGRLEKVTCHKNIHVFVDYAHTPDAIEKSLLALKDLVSEESQKIYIVFGCGGERDKTKRALMGQIAAKHADYVIITDDNPRNEDPDLIRKDILSSLHDCSNVVEIPLREEAIKFAIEKMKDEEILLIAGKGHENYQIIGDNKIYFNDKEIVTNYC